MTLQLNNNNGNNVQIDYQNVTDASARDSDILFPQIDGTVALQSAAGGLGGALSRATLFRIDGDFQQTGVTATIGGVAGQGRWELPDQNDEAGNITLDNQGVTQTDGVFTFPVTGIWLVIFSGRFTVDDSDRSANVLVQTSVNGGGSYTNRGQCSAGAGGTANINQNASCFCMFDVSNLANQRVRFRAESFTGDSVLRGNSSFTQTCAIFLRLGDRV